MEFVFEHATMIAVIAVVVIILAILASGYVKAPPDTAFIISCLLYTSPSPRD